MNSTLNNLVDLERTKVLVEAEVVRQRKVLRRMNNYLKNNYLSVLALLLIIIIGIITLVSGKIIFETQPKIPSWVIALAI